MDLASTTKFVFAFASKLPMSVCVCVCRRTKMGRFLSNLFLNLWSVCVFVFFCFAVDTSFFVFFGLVKKFCSLYISRFCALTLDDSFSFFCLLLVLMTLQIRAISGLFLLKYIYRKIPIYKHITNIFITFLHFKLHRLFVYELLLSFAVTGFCVQ